MLHHGFALYPEGIEILAGIRNVGGDLKPLARAIGQLKWLSSSNGAFDLDLKRNWRKPNQPQTTGRVRYSLDIAVFLKAPKIIVYVRFTAEPNSFSDLIKGRWISVLTEITCYIC
jgi:hypothetical protein